MIGSRLNWIPAASLMTMLAIFAGCQTCARSKSCCAHSQPSNPCGSCVATSHCVHPSDHCSASAPGGSIPLQSVPPIDGAYDSTTNTPPDEEPTPPPPIFDETTLKPVIDNLETFPLAEVPQATSEYPFGWKNQLVANLRSENFRLRLATVEVITRSAQDGHQFHQEQPDVYGDTTLNTLKQISYGVDVEGNSLEPDAHLRQAAANAVLLIESKHPQ